MNITQAEIDEIRNDKRRSGLYRKFLVARADGTDAPGGKHDGCNYFVLDINHDPFALPALAAYAEACKIDYPNLSNQLRHVALFSADPKEIIAENEERKLPHG